LNLPPDHPAVMPKGLQTSCQTRKTAENRRFLLEALFPPDERIPRYGDFRQQSVSEYERVAASGQ
jgi:hypothetical protein